MIRRKSLVIPQRVARARLAEEYDGIGQYVLVSLSQNSVSSAFKARVAAGDFGGGRKFPVGTPVTVFSHRGQLEVLLGNRPKYGCLEDFKVPYTNGWGNSTFPTLDGWRFINGEPGDDWYKGGDPEYFYVENGYGVIDQTVYYNWDANIWMFPKGDPTTFKIPAEYLVRFKAEVNASAGTGTQIDFYLGDVEKVGTIGSLGNTVFFTLYRSFLSNETVFYVDSFGSWLWTGSIYQEATLDDSYWDTWLLVRFRFEEYMIYGKIWKDGDPEPEDWMAYEGFEGGIYSGDAWKGLRLMLIYPYFANSYPPYANKASRYLFDYIKDINGSICKMSGPDFVPNFNGPL